MLRGLDNIAPPDRHTLNFLDLRNFPNYFQTGGFTSYPNAGHVCIAVLVISIVIGVVCAWLIRRRPFLFCAAHLSLICLGPLVIGTAASNLQFRLGLMLFETGSCGMSPHEFLWMTSFSAHIGLYCSGLLLATLLPARYLARRAAMNKVRQRTNPVVPQGSARPSSVEAASSRFPEGRGTKRQGCRFY